ncbi:MAG: tRNA (N(6)-L-threonylcarbamoyladenosine(37)-C(2))-methylthiotransferase MtaB [Ruminococcaceae bacterium]|nr:tRNA (N(6)-L-threonylcarbamoyladenosine(37)-C(2))-methylthiotransferase MtaB [Oscillospiraceae bacterium]
MKTVSFCTLGCRVNQYETRALAELFVNNGYRAVPFGEKCDVCVVNTCAVTEESQRKSAQMIRRALKNCPDVRVCGCYSQLCGKFEGVKRITDCFDKGALQDFCTHAKTDRGYELLNIGHTHPDKLIGVSKTRAYLKIQDGCSGKCTYCIIPKLRGKSRSRPAEEIIAEAKRLVGLGYKEIILTGIETAAYNFMPLYELIKKVAEIDGLKRLRLGSLDPNVLTDAFIKTVSETPKLMPHFHLSIQSGSTDVLKRMKRPYTAETAKERISALKKARPNIMLSADIICAFPGETEEEYNETLKFIKDIGFLHIHAFPYSKRPDTEAAVMAGQIPEEEKRRRMAHFLSVCDNIKNSILFSKLGAKTSVLVEKLAEGCAVGHSDDFCEATVKTNRPVAPGDIIECRITDAKDGKLICTDI